MITIKEGNILNATERVICQQVNCMGVMGSGLAKQIRNKYPNVYTSYKNYCKNCKDDNPKHLLGEVQTVLCDDGIVIANLFGQYNYGRDKRYTDYEALEKSLRGIKFIATLCHDVDSIALPYNLGCGLAGGDWNIVYKIIEDVFADTNVTIYKYS